FARPQRGHRLATDNQVGDLDAVIVQLRLGQVVLAAPCVIDGPINGTSFRAFVEQFLVPSLSAGDIVIMDNLGSHKRQAVRQLISSAGTKLFCLPRYSPDLNPI